MSALQAALTRGRDRYNAKFAQARRASRTIDGEAFAEHLRSIVAPIVAAVPPDRVDVATDALYELSLELMARSLLGAATIIAVWRDLLPSVAGLLAQAPRRVVAALSNAALALDDATRWIEAMAATAPRCSTADELLEVGKVLAWTCGMAHFRDSARAVLARLPDPLAFSAIAAGRQAPLPPTRRELMAALDDPWWRPGLKTGRPTGLSIVATAGGFRGFGGPFAAPPRVVAAGGRLFAYDNEVCCSLHADAFGATFQRHSKEPPEGAAAQASVNAAGVVFWRGLTGRVVSLVGPSSLAATDTTLAVTLPHSHKIFLVAAAR
jgi:hypothetical protein